MSYARMVDRSYFGVSIGIGIAIALATSAAAADACIHELPSHRSGHWHYRVVDGARCWEGPGMDRVISSRRVPTRVESKELISEPPRAKRPHVDPLPVEEEPGPTARPDAPTRVKIIPITNPPPVSRRIEAAFEETVTRCQDDIRICEILTAP